MSIPFIPGYSSRFQLGEGPSRGFLRDYYPLDGPFSSSNFYHLQCLLLLVYHGRGATEPGSRGVLRVTFPGDHDGDGEGDSDMTVIVEDEVQLEAEAGDSEDLAARALVPVSGRRVDAGLDEVIRVKRQFTTKIDARTGKPVKTGCKIEGYQTKEREVCEEIVERICEVTRNQRRIGRNPTRPQHPSVTNLLHDTCYKLPTPQTMARPLQLVPVSAPPQPGVPGYTQ